MLNLVKKRIMVDFGLFLGHFECITNLKSESSSNSYYSEAYIGSKLVFYYLSILTVVACNME